MYVAYPKFVYIRNSHERNIWLCYRINLTQTFWCTFHVIKFLK